jgi:hypothetical protein
MSMAVSDQHGSHDELLDRQGLYYHLQASQVA